jgi:hypothetical protein
MNTLESIFYILLIILPLESTMNWTPHVTVATIIQQNITGHDSDVRFLLVEEQSLNLSNLVINQPAGHVEANETLIEAAIRETLGIYTYTPPENPECTYYRICFFANVESFDAARTLDTGIVRTIWLTLNELKATGRARSPLVIRCVEDALAGQSFPLSMIFEQPRNEQSRNEMSRNKGDQ